jgi:hypothetical protein
MALIADQITVGPVTLPPVVKSDLQKLRESLTQPSDIKVINDLSYEIGVIDPFTVKKKRSIEELLLLNELRRNSEANAVFKEDDLLTFKQARESAKQEEIEKEIVKVDEPDWTIDRVVKGSFNKLRGKIEGVEVIDSYDKETPIFVVNRSVTDFNNIRNNPLYTKSDDVFVSTDQASIDEKSRMEEMLTHSNRPTRSSIIKKKRLEALKKANLIEYQKSAYNSDMLQSNKD